MSYSIVELDAIALHVNAERERLYRLHGWATPTPLSPGDIRIVLEAAASPKAYVG